MKPNEQQLKLCWRFIFNDCIPGLCTLTEFPTFQLLTRFAKYVREATQQAFFGNAQVVENVIGVEGACVSIPRSVMVANGCKHEIKYDVMYLGIRTTFCGNSLKFFACSVHVSHVAEFWSLC